MIIALIIWCTRYYGSDKVLKAFVIQGLPKVLHQVRVILILLLLVLSFVLKAQEVQQSYNIVRGSDIVGKLTVKKVVRADTVYYKMNSQFKTKFVFSVTGSTTEESVFYKGALLHSSFYRVVNGKVTCNNKSRWNGVDYEVNKSGKSTTLNANPIVLNMIMLMFSKPSNAMQVFSDHFHVFVNLKKVANDQFTLHLPDNTDNVYKYNGDRCSLIEIKGSLFKVKLVLIS